MTYVEGFLTPVPTANKAVYTKHAHSAIELFKGARRHPLRRSLGR
ncbi:DUF1428 domain-containing protein [Sphingomonas sp. J344]|nr:DUF1428 domain-containing protein [Sphingomonas sp. J344]MCR5871152.1 DUF1428 domain-containing protein [Sphingomonas sp. J344]